MEISDTLDGDSFDKDDDVVCVVTPGDGDDEGDDDLQYLGVEPLDPALADRFTFLIEVPDWDDLTSAEQIRLLVDQFRGKHPFPINLEALVDDATRTFALLCEQLPGHLVAYFLALGSVRASAELRPFSTRRMATLVRAALACYDYAMGFGVPFISGKDSLNNEFNTGTEVIAIPPTLLISAISVMDDVRAATTMDLKEAGNLLYMVGTTYPELGGSHYYGLFGLIGMTMPQVRVESARAGMVTLCRARAEGLVRSCHDLSEGGLTVAAAEMAFAGGAGLSLDLKAVAFGGGADCLRDDVLLFSESNSRFLVEVRPDNAGAFEAIMGDATRRIGEVSDSDRFAVTGLSGSKVIDAKLASLKSAWQTPLVPTHDEQQ